MSDFDFSYSSRKWTKEEKDKVVELREQGLGPKKISDLTGIPIGQIKFWVYGKKKTTKKSKTRKDSSLKTSYRLKHNDWLSWKSASLSSSFRSRYKTEIDQGVCEPIQIADIKNWIIDVAKICHYCKVILTEKNFGVDHAQPISRGGENSIKNLRACCQNCNTVKGALNEVEFSGLIALCKQWEDDGKSLFARLKRGNKFF